MKKMFAVCFCTLALGPAMLAQTPYGTWKNAQYGIEMTLQQDGSYVFKGPYGTSQGIYGFQGNAFSMQEANGNTIHYTVMTYSNTQLILADAQGMQLAYSRQPKAPTQVPPISGGRQLAQSGGHQLTTAHVTVGVDLIQFIIGANIKKSEIKELQTESTVEFKHNPALFISEIEKIHSAMHQLKQLTTLAEIGVARQQLFSEFHAATLSLNESQKPLLMKILYRYVKVVAFDPVNKLTVTEADVEGLINYMAFNAGLNGTPVQPSLAERQAFKQMIAAQFPAMALEQKQVMSFAAMLWQVVSSNWNQFNAAQKAQFRQQFQANNTAAPYQPPPPVHTSGKKSMADQLADQRFNNWAFKTMSDLSLQSHATSLNIIENIGGSDNYWEVKPYGQTW